MSNIRTGTGHTMEWRDTAETLLEALIPDDIEANESTEQVLARVEANTQPDVGDAEAFSGAELRKAILTLKQRKCPGLDRIEAEAVKCAYGEIHGDLPKLYNGCLEHGVFPVRWKVGSIRTLLKSPD
ncbi:hypothetical protein KPH14_011599 [Odynerus spinipes]|uniref:Reverse transcriptase n=1 Tax=Odynerus spinipes TaxID=1348599 RepID=A0AAD9RDG3_9HYME|nr:hypothetical protein KPH14_011599 [Odynerus spinipes]